MSAVADAPARTVQRAGLAASYTVSDPCNAENWNTTAEYEAIRTLTEANFFRALRGAPKSGTTYTSVLVLNAIRALTEGNFYGCKGPLVWHDYPRHEQLACGADDDALLDGSNSKSGSGKQQKLYPYHDALCRSGLNPIFGHGGAVGTPEFCNKLGNGNMDHSNKNSYLGLGGGGEGGEEGGGVSATAASASAAVAAAGLAAGLPLTPNTRTVLVMRHPVELLRAQHTWYRGINIPFVPDVDLLRCLIRYYTAWQAEAARNPQDIMLVRYEDLVTDTMRILPEMLEHWRLPWTKGSIATAMHESSRRVMARIEQQFRSSQDKRYRYTRARPSHATFAQLHSKPGLYAELQSVLQGTQFARTYGYTLLPCKGVECNSDKRATVIMPVEKPLAS